jgi:hypothetical protein
MVLLAASLCSSPLGAAGHALGEALGAARSLAALPGGPVDAVAARLEALGALAGRPGLALAASFVAGSAAGATSTLVSLAIAWLTLRRLRR